MNFKQVEAFRAVMLTRSMTKAASLLYTSQPNVSRWIALLEEKVGFRLFERQGTRLLPTSEAVAFYAEVERAFIGLDSLNDTADSIRRKGTGYIRVAAPGSIAHCVLPEAVRRLKAVFGDISVVINIGSSNLVAKWIATGYCDIGFCDYPADMPALKYDVIDTSPGVGIVCSSHALASRKILNPRDFDKEYFISYPSGTVFRDMIDRHFKTSTRILSLETPYGMTICAMVGLGLGVSIVNPAIVRALGMPNVREIPFSQSIEFNSFSVTSENFPPSVLAKHMVNCVKEAFVSLKA
jgi:DNA-binding transcriptional LysR family regulator